MSSVVYVCSACKTAYNSSRAAKSCCTPYAIAEMQRLHSVPILFLMMFDPVAVEMYDDSKYNYGVLDAEAFDMIPFDLEEYKQSI